MNDLIKAGAAWLWARVCEPSSWAGLSGVLGATATQLPQDWGLTHGFLTAAMIAGAIAFGLRERGGGGNDGR